MATILVLALGLAAGAVSATAQTPGCATLAGDHILAKDLAAVAPEFAAIPPQTELATAPLPGSRRTFHVAELASLAERYSLPPAGLREICFEWPMEHLDPARIVQAMQSALGIADAKIEIAETSLYPVPRGRLEFSRERLGVPASPEQRSPVLWPGDVVYGSGRRFAIWARVRIAASCTRLVAIENLRSDQPIEARAVALKTETCFPRGDGAADPKQVEGMQPVRPIAAGQEVRLDELEPADDIVRGELVSVEVRIGAAHLTFTGRAESAGRSGDQIDIRNLQSNRVFQARVSGKGKAQVLAASSTVP
ncbi:MAG: flagellar basal body P-ring formation chaperone FlgA [Bryobacteraceae bacterium]